MSMNMNKVNMSLDEIINSTRRNKKSLEVVRGNNNGRRSNFQQNGFKRRRNNSFEGQTSRGSLNRRAMRGRGRGRGSISPRDNREERRPFRNYKRYNNFEGEKNQFNKRTRLIDRRRKIISPRNKDSNFRRLFVSNLHKEIINSELKNIFSRIGPLKRCGIHWDSLGNSKGTADVEYERPEDARKAIEEFDNAEVDGMPMKVTMHRADRGQPLRRENRRRLGTRRLGGNRRRINIK